MSVPFTKKLKHKNVITTIGKLFSEYLPKTDCNPISQRLPIFVEYDNQKSVGIIDTTMNLGVSAGMITVVKLVGSKFTYESIDGGHRKRAIRDYINGEFAVNGKFFEDLTDKETTNCLNTEIVLCVYEPLSNYDKGEIFRILNGTMHKVNNQEILNSYGDIDIANAVRYAVREEFQKQHLIFELTDAKNSKWIDIQNKRLKLEEFVARIYYRYYEDGNLGSRTDKDLMKMYSDDTIKIKKLSEKVKKHLDFLFELVKVKKTVMNKMGWKELNTLSNLCHYFNEKLGEWKMHDAEKFYKNFVKVFYDYSVDVDNKWKDVVDFDFENAETTIKETFNNYTTCHDSYKKQEQLCKWIVEHKNLKINQGITILDVKRLFKKEEKEAVLARQDLKCAVDGKKLDYADAEAAHDVAYILGGSTTDLTNCAMIRKEYNRKMGTMTIAQYKKILIAEGKI